MIYISYAYDIHIICLYTYARIHTHTHTGKDGVLVPPRAGDALVFFSFDDTGGVESASLHGGRPTSSLKWIANQWVRLDLAAQRPGESDEAVAAEVPSAQVPRGPGFGPRVIN